MAESSQNSSLYIKHTTFETPTRIGTLEPGGPSADSSCDGYTLSAYGDISLSNVYFIPGLPQDISLKQQDPEHEIRRARLMPGQRRRPSLIQNILPVSPTKATTDNFEKLLENIRPRREPAKLTGGPPILSPRTRAINLKVVEKSREVRVPKPPLAARAPIAPLPSAPITKAKPKERPLRGFARLPPRLPIPQWDLLESGVCGDWLRRPPRK